MVRLEGKRKREGEREREREGGRVGEKRAFSVRAWIKVKYLKVKVGKVSYSTVP